MTVAALVGLGRSRWKERTDIGLLKEESADAAIHLGLRETDGHDGDATFFHHLPPCTIRGRARVILARVGEAARDVIGI